MEDRALFERQFAAKIAAEYTSRGYQVSRDQLLEFFPGFRADLVVRKGDETKVIEVRARSSLVEDPF